MPGVRWLVVACLACSSGERPKDGYSADCASEAPSVAPWNQITFARPDSRRCEATELRFRIEHLTGDRDRWADEYDAALLAHGYTKVGCDAQRCTYAGAGEHVSLQVDPRATGERPRIMATFARTLDLPPAPPPVAELDPRALGLDLSKPCDVLAMEISHLGTCRDRDARAAWRQWALQAATLEQARDVPEAKKREACRKAVDELHATWAPKGCFAER
jgi:hypothetical protein